MKIRVIILFTAVILLFSSCAVEVKSSPVLLGQSYLNGWYVDDDIVYMVCRLIIYNKYETEEQVTITAYSDEDVGKLLKSSKLIGYNEDMSQTVFKLESGNNEFVVVFVGAFGTTDEKVDFEIPDTIKIEYVE